MDNITLNQINNKLEDATPEQLIAVLNILRKELPVLRLKHKGGPTALLEVPGVLCEGIMTVIRSQWPEYSLQWTDGKTELERSLEQRLDRMRRG